MLGRKAMKAMALLYLIFVAVSLIPRSSEHIRGSRTVFLVHGLFFPLSNARSFARKYSSLFPNSSIVSIEYRGFVSSSALKDVLLAINRSWGKENIIFGESHGAYLTLLAAEHYNFSEVIVVSAPTNLSGLFDYFKSKPSYWLSFAPFVAPDLLKYKKPKAYLERISPVNRACKMKSNSFLIIHGKQDPLIPVEQAYELYSALKACGKKVNLCIVEGGHPPEKEKIKECLLRYYHGAS